MKALGSAIGFVLVFFFGILAWAVANGSSDSGEPHIVLQIDKDANRRLARGGGGDADRAQKDKTGAILMNVAHGEKAKSRPQLTSRPSNTTGLVEDSQYGPLPRRGADGRTPASVYAHAKGRPAGTRPRIAILMTGLGLNQKLSEKAVRQLPEEISLAYSAYGRKLKKMTHEARKAGHELMLQVPMEPRDYPESDTGPKTLLISGGEKKNLPLLHWALGRFTGYFGVVNAKGGRYLADTGSVRGLFRELQHRGLVFFRDQAGSLSLVQLADQSGIGYSNASLQIDRKPTAEAVRMSLGKLEAIARRTGLAIGVAHLHPVSIDMLSAWSQSLKKKGILLVPVSAAYQQGK